MSKNVDQCHLSRGMGLRLALWTLSTGFFLLGVNWRHGDSLNIWAWLFVFSIGLALVNELIFRRNRGD